MAWQPMGRRGLMCCNCSSEIIFTARMSVSLFWSEQLHVYRVALISSTSPSKKPYGFDRQQHDPVDKVLEQESGEFRSIPDCHRATV